MKDTNTWINQTKTTTNIYPQKEDKQIHTTYPQRTQDQENNFLRTQRLLHIYIVKIP